VPKLFVIDDRDQTVEMVHRHLPQFETVTRCDRSIPCQVCEERDRGCPLKCAHDYREAAEALSRQKQLPDLVVLDLHFALPEDRLLPEDKSGIEGKRGLEEIRRTQGLLILEKLRRDYPNLPVVLLTTTDAEFDRPRDPLIYFCENEVVDSRTLAAEITRALELQSAAQEGPVFWGKSPGILALRRQIGVLSRSPLPVLIEGETGTGKSFLAEQVLHPRSGAKGPLVVTDLSTIPTTLLPAHLFGTRRGSYTGSVDDQPGVFEQAHNGTLFLDEIGNLDADLQRQLLLVLERGTVTRLGDVRARPAAPRLVAATNLDLEALVREGRFRHDLYMRLNPATRLRVPPLRERREDLPDLVRFAFLEALRAEQLRPLVRAYLARFPTPDDFVEENDAVVFGKPQASRARRDAFTVFLSKVALRRLVEHSWPGNHRELKLLAVSALVHALAQHLDAESAPRERAPAVLVIPDAVVESLLGNAERRSQHPRPLAAAVNELGRRVEVTLKSGHSSFADISADVERQYLVALFEAMEGDLDRMAAELFGDGASRRRVHLRMNQLGLRLRELRGAQA
jgi:two-component system nitrogen regulation response regulator GlnG